MRWVAVNESRGAILGDRVAKAITLGDRLKGLLGRAALEAGEGLLIEPCNSIHTFGMRFPIDALFLDADGRILRIYPALKPWRASTLVPRARSVLELPAGACRATGTVPGDAVGFHPTGP